MDRQLIHFRLDRESKAKLEELAKRDERPLSAYLRFVLHGHLAAIKNGNSS